MTLILEMPIGPGGKILYVDSNERVAVDSQAAQGVEFDVCMNTTNTITRDTGHKPEFIPLAVPVAYGVGRIMEPVEKGYILERL